MTRHLCIAACLTAAAACARSTAVVTVTRGCPASSARVLIRTGPVAGASVHLDNRSYVTEPQTTNTAGTAVLLVYMDAGPSDTGTITVFPPAGYEPPLPQAVTIPARDTVSINVTLRRP